MRYTIATALILTSLFAAGASAASNPKKPAATTASTATHAVQGVVQSIDASTLVIKSSGHKGKTMSFALNPATSKEGTAEVGSTVSVRYRTEGSAMVATAVAAQPAKAAKAEHSAAKK